MDPRNIFISYARPDAQWAERLRADLDGRGHRCWVDTSAIVGGDQWERSISEGIEQADVCLSLASEAAQRSDWVTRELLFAEKRRRPVIPVLLEDCEPRLAWIDRQPVALWSDYKDGLRRLMQALAAVGRRPEAPAVGERRERELAYLRRLQLRELVHIDLYTPLAAYARKLGRRVGPMPAPVMRPELDLLRRFRPERPPEAAEPQRFEDVGEAVCAAPRVVLLGEPGAGKTTALWRLAADAVGAAEDDPGAPLPLLARLGRWTEPEEPLAHFLRRELGEIGSDLDALLREQRALLLLDGLNETPTARRESKAAQVRDLVEKSPELGAVVTCRGLDYTGRLELDLDTLAIQPMDPPRVLDFVHRYLEAWDPAEGAERAEELFWRLAGGEAVREVWRVWERCGAGLGQFFSSKEIPCDDPNVYSQTTWAQKRVWAQKVRDPRSLMRLAGNPYLLLMLARIYQATGEIPANRAALFDGFVEILLVREGLAAQVGHRVEPTETGIRVLEGLAGAAWIMQTRRDEGEDQNVRTLLNAGEARRIVDPEVLRKAASASLVAPGSGELRFSHQLLQEYFTARGMRRRLESGELEAARLWPPQSWWEHSGWEEAAVLLAGLYAEDCTPVLEWLSRAQPEVAARCVLRSGAETPDRALERLREAWLPRLTDLRSDPEPEARAAVGRALGSLRLGGRPLDDRPGVGLDESGLPDVDWVDIPAGPFLYQDGERRELPAFAIARYPITNAQYQAFIDDGGYWDDRWWRGLAKRIEEPGSPVWDLANHPRETVSWFEAVAFCQWLSQRLGREVRLPTELEWEKAARGTGGREYPWGDRYRQGFANVDETGDDAGPHDIGRTTAVGIYPQGASLFGVLDMSGNVREWCLNEYRDPVRTGLGGGAPRVLRGGSWLSARGLARAAVRFDFGPVFRSDVNGFRVCRSSPI